MSNPSEQNPNSSINAEPKLRNLCNFWQSSSSTIHTSSSNSSTQQLHSSNMSTNNSNNSGSGNYYQQHGRANYDTASFRGGVTAAAGVNVKPVTVSSVARSLLPTRRRLKFDPPNNLYFPYEPGKQVKSAVRIKNTSKSHVAFKFQTTAPKSCYMRPPGGILAPGQHVVATVFKFVEQPENNEKMQELKKKVKFKIMSLKVKAETEYAPELFDEQKDQANVERVLRVIFLDPERPCSAMDKLNRQLAEAEAEVETRKKPPTDNGPNVVGEGLVIDEWKERREKYLAKQQVDAVESL